MGKEMICQSLPGGGGGVTSDNGLGGEAEFVFVNLLRSPGFDSQPGGPVRQPCLSCRPARLHWLAELIPQNRFLGSIKVYKYGSGWGVEVTHI